MKQQNQTGSSLTSKSVNLIGAIIFTIAAVGIWVYLNRENIREYVETQKKRDAAHDLIIEIQGRNSQLRRLQQSLQFNGIEGERQARERHGLIKPGENVMFFTYDKEATGPLEIKNPATSKTIGVTIPMPAEPDSISNSPDNKSETTRNTRNREEN